jgi:hypothetical protein
MLSLNGGAISRVAVVAMVGSAEKNKAQPAATMIERVSMGKTFRVKGLMTFNRKIKSGGIQAELQGREQRHHNVSVLIRQP